MTRVIIYLSMLISFSAIYYIVYLYRTIHQYLLHLLSSTKISNSNAHIKFYNRDTYIKYNLYSTILFYISYISKMFKYV